MRSGPVLLALPLLLSACGEIRQNVKPIALSGLMSQEICVVENRAVRESFLDVYKAALAQKGLTVRMLPEGTAVDACPLTSIYAANWRWDLALYLAYVDLKVYQNGNLTAEALYDSLKAALDAEKFIDATKKIDELTDRLFSG